ASASTECQNGAPWHPSAQRCRDGGRTEFASFAERGGGSRFEFPDGPIAAAALLRPPPKQLARNSVVSIPRLPSGLAFEDLAGGGNNCETAFLRGFKIFAPAALEQPPFLVRKKARRPQYRPVGTGSARARDWALE